MQERGGIRGLVLLCVGYFAFYIVTGTQVKWFPLHYYGPDVGGEAKTHFLVDSTIGSSVVVLILVFALRWVRIRSNQVVRLGPLHVPRELLYIIPSGLCLAVVGPATVLLLSLPISVMVAMVIMRGSVILLCRIIDAIQIRQGLLRKKVLWEENVAVLIAVLAVATNLFGASGDDFAFFTDGRAMTLLGAYLGAYGIRLYLMNYYKNTRKPGAEHDSKAWFAWEQISNTVGFVIIAVVLYVGIRHLGWTDDRLAAMESAVSRPDWGAIWRTGVPQAASVMFGTLIWLYEGHSATFVGLLNRLTSLLAGVGATLLFAVMFGGGYPSVRDWISVGLIVIAFVFLTRAERRRDDVAST